MARCGDDAVALRLTTGSIKASSVPSAGNLDRSYPVVVIRDAAAYGIGAGFAALLASTSTVEPHQYWGQTAVWGYLAGVLIAVAVAAISRWSKQPLPLAPIRVGLMVAVIAATLVLPMLLMITARRDGTPHQALGEVGVVERAGQRLNETGSPYLGGAELERASQSSSLGTLAYTPYGSVMAVFGLPRAVSPTSAWTDARVAFAATGCAVLLVAVWVGINDRRRRFRLFHSLMILPPAALALATGGDDVPVIALALLSMALLARRRWAWAGIAIGLALAMKTIVLPLGVMLAVLMFSRHRPGTPRDGRIFVGALLAVPIATSLPLLIADPNALIENLVRYPLGLTEQRSPASSPLIGWALTQWVPFGKAIALAVLAAALIAIAVAVVRRPPGTIGQAALWTALILTTIIVLAPATRFGYFIYPGFLGAWATATERSGLGIRGRNISGPTAGPGHAVARAKVLD